jgi:hypothetical protein
MLPNKYSVIIYNVYVFGNRFTQWLLPTLGVNKSSTNFVK